MKVPPARQRQRILERAAHELVPVCKRAILGTYHPDVEAAVNTAGIRPDRLLEKPCLGLSRDDADELGDFTCCRRKLDRASEYGIANGDRHGIGACREYLSHKERISAGDFVNPLRSASGTPCKLCNGRF